MPHRLLIFHNHFYYKLKKIIKLRIKRTKKWPSPSPPHRVKRCPPPPAAMSVSPGCSHRKQLKENGTKVTY